MDISPEELLQQAIALSSGAAGAPNQSDLRRAVSNCYYGVFHALTARSAELLVTEAGRKPMRDYLRRGFEHRTMKDVCIRFSRNVDSRNADAPVFQHLRLPMSSITADVRFVAQSFLTLQISRHEADYDHSVVLDEPSVERLQALAQSTLDAIAALDRADDVHYAFLVALYAERRGGGTPQ